ncbi:MAG: chorismate mutase [Pyrinomonas sp.]|uniref:chorismate mutase n=1 Tax=Pyrinomonas sp. TaxID=2080306 RepID=UPI00331AB84A
MSTIEDWRAEIDRIDKELLHLLNERARIALEIGALKRTTGAPLYDGARERQVLAHVRCANRGPLDDRAVMKIFRRIIGETRRVAIEHLTEVELNGRA